MIKIFEEYNNKDILIGKLLKKIEKFLVDLSNEKSILGGNCDVSTKKDKDSFITKAIQLLFLKYTLIDIFYVKENSYIAIYGYQYDHIDFNGLSVLDYFYEKFSTLFNHSKRKSSQLDVYYTETINKKILDVELSVEDFFIFKDSNKFNL